MRRRLRHLTALLAIAFFFTPLLLLASGVRATEFENRRLAERPSLEAGWDVFDHTTSFFIDHMPLRERAVRANAWKSVHVFRTTPTYTKRATNAMQPPSSADAAPPAAAPTGAQQVLPGVDGWLYLQGDTERACYPFIAPAAALDRWERLGQVIARSGRRVVVVVAPDKSTIYPEHLPSPFTNEDCAAKGRAKLWATLEASNEPTFLPLREAVSAGRRASSEPLFYETDSHWNPRGSSILVREVLARVGTRPLQDSEIVDEGEHTHDGDLGIMLGTPVHERSSDVRIETAEPLLPGRVAFLHDSFGIGPYSMLESQSRSFEAAVWGTDDPSRWIEVIGDADTVVIETVEREVTFRADALLTDEFFRSLQQELAANR